MIPLLIWNTGITMKELHKFNDIHWYKTTTVSDVVLNFLMGCVSRAFTASAKGALYSRIQ